MLSTKDMEATLADENAVDDAEREADKIVGCCSTQS